MGVHYDVVSPNLPASRQTTTRLRSQPILGVLVQKRQKMSEQERYEQDFMMNGQGREHEFQGAEDIAFGERVDAPPVLPRLKVKNVPKKQQQQPRKRKKKM